jgi:preprotein translocase subunit SecG
MVQTGKGGSVGGMLSGGSSGSVFGASTADVMTRITRWTGIAFIVLALLLSFLYSKKEDVLVPEIPANASFDQAPNTETSNEKATEAPIGE